MSTSAEVQSNYPGYVLYHLHLNDIDDSDGFTLVYSGGLFSIDTWTYGITQPTDTDLEAYTLADISIFMNARDQREILNNIECPLRVSEIEENALSELGGINAGSLIFCTDDNQLHFWNGSAWVALATV